MSQDIILRPIAASPASVIVSGALITAVDTLEQRLGHLPAITDQASMDAVRAVMVESSKLAKQVDAQRQNAQEPWDRIVDAIGAAAKPYVLRLNAIKADSKAQIEDWLVEQDRLKLEAQRAAMIAQAAATAALQASQADHTAPLPQLQITTLPQEIRAPTSTRMVLSISNFDLIPRHYYDLNQSRLEADLRAGLKIPGAELVPSTHVVAR